MTKVATLSNEIPKRKHRKALVVALSKDTVIVLISLIKVLPKYGKRLAKDRRYKAQCVDGRHKVGDLVTIEECRPLSRDKRWRVI